MRVDIQQSKYCPSDSVVIDAVATGIRNASKRPSRAPAYGDAQHWPTQEPQAIPFGAPALDLGLWLFSGRVRRHEGWLRLGDEVCEEPAHSRSESALGYNDCKRAVDIVGSLFLLILLAPVLVFLALLVKLDSPGPALFRQTRIGKGGLPFVLWKFRSMRRGVNAYARSPTTWTDRRMTRLGRLLRRTSLDELPQLLNVLTGDMSLIGPRPEMPFIVASYSPLQRARLAIKPGMTGLWQISPARIAPIHENLQFDLHYIRHRNFALDVAILLRTLSVVIGGTENS